MIQEERFSAKRLVRILLMAFGIVILSLCYVLKYRYTIDFILSLLLLQGLFFPIFAVFLMLERRSGRLNRNQVSSYRKLTNVFLLMLCCYFGFSYLPAYCAPVMIPAIFLATVSNLTVGMVSGIYLDIILCLATGSSYHELAVYLLLTVCGCLISEFLERKNVRIYCSILMFAMSLTLPGLFYFWNSFAVNDEIVLFGAASGAVCNLVVWLFFDRMHQEAKNEVLHSYQDIIRPEFPLVKEIKNYSQIDYMHAMNVSQVSYQCAELIGSEPNVAAAAGFYYRLGKLEGEPFIENGVMLAQNNCFPMDVVQILAEYNGVQHLPSTRESAIVHMVDVVLTKFELLDKETLSSTWNRNIVIFQTLDEKSSSGIYDESGLSMNQYLKIREFLSKGGGLF